MADSSSGPHDVGLPRPDPLDPEAFSSSGIRRSLLPPLWQRFQQHLRDPTSTPPATGAHVTLADLEKLAELREAASAPVFAEPPPLPQSDGKISGWVGTPDPGKFAAGTNALTPSEVEEEVGKGNIVMLDDWVKEISNLDLWEKRALYESMLKDWMQHRFFVQTEKGSKVSFWDLYRYVHHNPELKALVESRRQGYAMAESTAGPSGSHQPGTIAPGLYEDSGNSMWAQLDLDSARQLPWGLAGTGQVWSRRPTRWLWGADAQLDLEFAMYVHEDKAHEILGSRYSHKDPRVVLGDQSYVHDIIKAGPLMGMTFMLTAARELPVQEARNAWVSRLATRLQRRASQQPVPRSVAAALASPAAGNTASSSASSTEASSANSGFGGLPATALSAPSPQLQQSMDALFSVYCMLDAEQLKQQTKMLDLEGFNFRKGASIIATTGPSGKILLQATSPGMAREREGYLLGAVQDEGLAAALVEEFLGEDAVDPKFAAAAPVNMLMFANGFKTDNTNQNPLMRRLSDGPAYKTELIPAKPSVFRLPRVGAREDTGEATPLLLSGVQDRVLVGAMSDVFQRAFKAASDVLQPESSGQGSAQDDATLFKSRQDAAHAVLKDGLSSLGLDVQGLGFEEMQGELQSWTADEKAALAEALGAGGASNRGKQLRHARVRLADAR